MKKTLDATANAVRQAFRTASEEVGRDASEIKEKIVVPAVQFGKNRIVSAFMGGKTGFVVGGLVGGPLGMAKGAAVGAFIGAVAGPAAMERIEKALKPSNENDPSPKP